MKRNVPVLRFKGFEEEWKEQELGDICKITMGQSPSSSCYNDNFQGIPLVQGNADIYKRITAPRFYTSEITKKCEVNDIIMSVRAPVGTISLANQECCIGRGVCSMKASLSQKYLYQILLNQEDKWGRISQGSTFESINSSDIKELKLKIPKVQEQEKIASFLTKVDSLIEKQGEKVKNFELYKKGMMQKIFSQEIRFKDNNRCDYPKWEEKKLKSICTINQGLQIAISERFSEYKNGRYFYITNEFLKVGSDKKYYINNPNESVLCKENDILMTRTGNTGKVVTNVSGAFHNNFFKVNYNRKLIIKGYIYYYLIYDKTQKIIRRLAGSSTIPDLNHNDFYNIKMNIPNLEEQIKIAKCLSNIDTILDKESKKLEELKEWKKGLLQQMFV